MNPAAREEIAVGASFGPLEIVSMSYLSNPSYGALIMSNLITAFENCT